MSCGSRVPPRSSVRGPASGGSRQAQRASELVWAAVEGGGLLAEVDLSTGRMIRRLQVGGGPHNITVGPDGTVAAAQYGSDRIAIVNGGRVEEVRLGGRPHDVKIDGRRIVVANEGAGRLDLVSIAGKELGRVPLSAAPHDLAIAPGGKLAWVSMDGTDRLAVVNLDTRRVHYVSTGRRPHDLLFSPDGRLFVTDWRGALFVLSATGKLLASRRLGRQSHHLSFTPDGDQVWITDNALDEVFVLGSKGLRILARLRVSGAPHHVAITSDGRYAVVANNTRGTLVVYSVSSRRRVASIQVGRGPHGVWAVPASVP